MFRYYVSYAFAGGFGAIDITSTVPIKNRDTFPNIMNIINQEVGHTLPSLMILGFSEYASTKASTAQHARTDSPASK